MNNTSGVSSEQSGMHFRVPVAAALMIGAIAALWYVAVYARSTLPGRTFFSTAESKVVAVPDVAEINFGVLTEGGKDLANLQRENAEKTNRISAFLKERGVGDKDIKTQSYTVTPRYQYFSCPPPRQGGAPIACPPSEITGYSIQENVIVKVRDLNKAGDILAGVVEKGANTVGGLNFTVDDPSKFENKAREEAIAKARAKAEVIAKAGGFRLGKLISINESFNSPPTLFAEGMAMKEGMGGAGAAPAIQPGSQEIRVEVTLTYEMR